MHENQQNTNINKYHMFVFDVLNALSFRKRAYYKKVENLGKKRGKRENTIILQNLIIKRKICKSLNIKKMIIMKIKGVI